MITSHYRDEIARAAFGDASAIAANPERLDQLAVALAQAEAGKQILRAKGYGQPGLPIHATVRLVPDAKGK